MMTFVATLHIIVCLVLIGLVLVQDSKGGGALGMGGGGSNSLLGATGAQTLAARMTRWTAVILAFTCISLTLMTANRSKSVLDSHAVAPAAPVQEAAPAAAATPAAPATESAQPAAPTEATPAQEPKK